MKLNLLADGDGAAGGGPSIVMVHNERLADRLDEFARARDSARSRRNGTRRRPTRKRSAGSSSTGASTPRRRSRAQLI